MLPRPLFASACCADRSWPAAVHQLEQHAAEVGLGDGAAPLGVRGLGLDELHAQGPQCAHRGQHVGHAQADALQALAGV